MSDGLFPADPLRVEPAQPLSADQRRTVRARNLIAAGFHPLLVAVGYRGSEARLHPYAAPEVCSPDAPSGQPFTCGSCRFRVVVGWHSRSYPKCIADLTNDEDTLDASRRASHGAATDVRAWWPACRDYEPGDQTLSPDAARSIPVMDGPGE